VLEWCDPLMGAGYWIPELVALVGAECLFGGVGEHTSTVSVQELADADPDFIIFACCGFSVERSARELEQCGLLRNPAWQQLAERKAGRIFVADGNRYFNRSGPSVVDSAEIVGQVIGLPPSSNHASPSFGMEEVAALQDLAPKNQQGPCADLHEVSHCHGVCDASEVARSVVQGLQSGTEEGVLLAYQLSAVSACMPLDRYKSIIVEGSDFTALSNRDLELQVDEARATGSNSATVMVEMKGTGGGLYSFKMKAFEGGRWMVEGVAKVSSN